MAFGALKGTLTVSLASITNPTSAVGSVSVSVGDLVFAVLNQQTALTVTAWADNLGNTYTPLNAGNDVGAITGRAAWARVTTAGTLTSVDATCTASANDVNHVVAVIEGPFATSPLDANPANGTTDVTTPYVCPATGTLAQASEVVMCFVCRGTTTVMNADSPNLKAIQATEGTQASVTIGYQTVAATTTVSPGFGLPMFRRPA